jgi:uncharacterized protein
MRRQHYFALVGLWMAGVIKGATGIGYSSCALPFLVTAVGLKPAIAVLVVPAMASNVMLVLSVGHVRTTVRQFWPLYLATIPGIAAGIYALTIVDQKYAIKLLGWLIVAHGIQSMLMPSYRLHCRAAQNLRVPVGLLNGFFAGLTGAQVLPLMPYMLALNLHPQHFVQAVNLAVITGSLFLGAGLMLIGMMSLEMLMLSVLAVIPALMGVQTGVRYRQGIDDRQFRKLAILVLTAIGITFALK